MNPAESESLTWKLRSRKLELARRPLVMGILNVTPDSFSDGGRYRATEDAVATALRMQQDGADIIDIGGESTRPYSDPVAETEELDRVIPVIEQLHDKLLVPISVDTSKARVAEAACNAGAEIINDVTGLEGDPEMAEVAAQSGAGVCVMHMQGTPQTMQDAPKYENVVEEIYDYLRQRKESCLQAGIEAQRICLDPGIGFGKTHQHNLDLLCAAARFRELGSPILIGHSRKGFINKTLDIPKPTASESSSTLQSDKHNASRRRSGTLGVSLAVAAAGIEVIRVHDVRETVDALALFRAAGGIQRRRAT